MNKLSIFILVAIGLMACQSEPATAMPNDGGKTLIVYYSYTGNTEEIVSSLQTLITADVVEVTPVDKTLDYAANNYRIGTEQLSAIQAHPNDASSYPAIDPVQVDLSQYATVIIATPLWWSQMATNMQAFLFQHGADMAGKNIGLIVSSHSSGISGVEADAHRLVSNGNFFSRSLWINASNHSNRLSLLRQWLTDINYQSATALESVSVDLPSAWHPASGGSPAAQGIYTLSGQFLAEAPTSGVYIENGQTKVK